MKNSEKQGVLHGAAVLAVSGIIVKIIGACFKIPIGGILKPEGMADFSIAYNIYALLFVISTAGVPIAVSKLTAQEYAMERGWQAQRIYRVSLLLFSVVGAVGSAVMYIFAGEFAKFMSSPRSASAIRAVSPAVFFVSVSAVIRGYYQGMSNMYPTAISQVLEALGKLAVGFGVAWFFVESGFGFGMAAAGAVFGVSVGALMSAMYLLFVCSRNKGKEKKPKLAVPRSSRKIVTELVKLAIPITMGAAVISLTNVIDSALVMKILQKIGYAERESMWLYGAYNYACNLFNLPSALITTLGISLVPAVSSAFVREDYNKLSYTVGSAMKLAMLIALPAAAGLFSLARPIMFLLYGGSVESEAIAVSGELLAYLALAVPALGTVTVTNAVHQACGNVRLPIISMLCGTGVKLISNYFFVSVPKINIKGAAISTVLCYTIIAVINCAALSRLKIRVAFSKIYVKPIILAVITGVAAYSAFIPFSGGSTAKIGVITAVLAGALVCGVCAVLFGAVDEEERKLVFKGGKISKFLKIH